MNGYYALIEVLNCIPEALIIFMFYGRIWDKKYYSKLPYAAACLLSMAVFALSALFVSNSYIRVAVTAAVLLSLTLLYKNTALSALFAAVYYIFMVVVSEILFTSILSAAYIGSPREALASGMGRTAGMVGTKIFDFWFVVYSCSLYRRKNVKLPLNYWIQILLMPFLSAVILCSIFSENTKNAREIVFCVLSLPGLLYINLSVFNYFESYDKQVRLAALERIMENEEKNYRELSASYSEIRNIRHDLKNQTAVLNEMIVKERYSEAKEYIKSLYETAENVTSIYYTGDAAVDSIINLKAAYAKSLGIRFTAVIGTKSFVTDRIALCRILGNALDNAIEACERTEEKDKSIDLEINTRGEMLMIKVENTSVPVDVNSLTTQKCDKTLHGIGLKSIENTVLKSGGHVVCEYKDGRFVIRILV